MGFAVEDEGGFGGGVADGLGVEGGGEILGVFEEEGEVGSEKRLGGLNVRAPLVKPMRLPKQHLARAAARPGAPMWWRERSLPSRLS
jgi:hypothetical protein